MSGRVEAMFVAGAATELPEPVERVRVVAGVGLDGDRYARGVGTYWQEGKTGQDLTLVSAEALDDVGLAWAEARRNVVTRGIDLNALVGKRFRVGELECYGQRLCEPCTHLESLTRPGILEALVHRGGLRADVITGGELAVGDAVEEL